ncbi:unnamed protein product [Mytilus edulis]|uniref:Ig-like domain-containing protein n=1 Tax=Mytilus edulis TaxID=6550 RepID=A0A8S3UIH8_MYTED|nr:unnamed protein product [Mytilus edulis]
MTFRMVLEKLFLVWLFSQDSMTTVYILEGSTMDLTFNVIIPKRDLLYQKICLSYLINPWRVKPKIYDTILHVNSFTLPIINVTARYEGVYWLNYGNLITVSELKISNMSCSSRSIEYVCAIEGSSPILTFTIDVSVYHNIVDEDYYSVGNFLKVRDSTTDVHLQIYNVTLEDEGFFKCHLHELFGRIKLEVVKLRFINQSDENTIIGQEGIEMDIRCISDTVQDLTLMLESNGIVKAVGDKKTVIYSVIPVRTDHLSNYECMTSTHSSIMIAVKLNIRYPPAGRVIYTNGTIGCECDGNPAIYTVYRLDQISKHGELVHSVNLVNETFTFDTDPFPYQRNGKFRCVVCNGIPDTNGNILHTWSRNVNYEGPPVFAKENRYVKVGKQRKSSMTMSFQVYSYPAVEEIFLEKIGHMDDKKMKITKYTLKDILLYSEYDNSNGIQGYDILIESELVDKDDFQAYCITITNRLGASNFNFEIIRKDERVIKQEKNTHLVTLYIVGAVLLSLVIGIAGFCINHVKHRVQKRVNVHEDSNYHIYDECGSITNLAASNLHSTNSNNDNTDPNQTQLRTVGISTDDNAISCNKEFINKSLSQSELDDTNLLNDLSPIPFPFIPNMDKEVSSDQKSQVSYDSDSEGSNSVMVCNVGDGYEHAYQTVILDRPESHLYIGITRERNNSISLTESNQSED